MTVKELVALLAEHDPNEMVYVPSNTDGTNDTVRFVARCPHLQSIPGVKISDDVALLPGAMEHFVTDSDKIEDRIGDA